MRAACGYVYIPVVDIHIVATIISRDEWAGTMATGEGQMKYQRLVLRLVCLVVIATAAFAGQKKQVEPIRVLVFTAQDASGFVDEDSRQRTDSVEDLKKDLSKDSTIQLVSAQDSSDVALEVLGRGYEETGSATTTQDYGEWHTYPDTVRVVRVGLRAGGYSTLFEGTSSFGQRGLIGVASGLWKMAANNAAKSIEDWIRANHDTLLSIRLEVQSTLTAELGACAPSMQTPNCRVAVARYEEALTHKGGLTDAKFSVEGVDSDILVETSQKQFDKLETPYPEWKDFTKSLCPFNFKRVVVVSPSTLARREFEQDCSVEPQTAGTK
jgi:hypothetical protein